MAQFHLVKIRGTARIPDYVQLRDENFTLIAYFRLDRPEKALERCRLEAFQEQILTLAHALPFGEVKAFDLPTT